MFDGVPVWCKASYSPLTGTQEWCEVFVLGLGRSEELSPAELCLVDDLVDEMTRIETANRVVTHPRQPYAVVPTLKFEDEFLT